MMEATPAPPSGLPGGPGTNYNDEGTVQQPTTTEIQTETDEVIIIPTGQDLKVYIGGLDYRLRDEFVKKILERVGSLAAWERFRDPFTLKYANYGFAHFLTRDTAVTASRVLNGLKFSTTAFTNKDSESSSLQVTLEAKNDNRVGAFTYISESDEKRIMELRKRILNEIAYIEEQVNAIPIKKVDNGLPSIEFYNKPLEIIEEQENQHTEEEINAVLQVDPRQPDISDEVYKDLANFRRTQAIDEIISARRRKRLLVKFIHEIREKHGRGGKNQKVDSLESNSGSNLQKLSNKDSSSSVQKPRKRRGFHSAPAIEEVKPVDGADLKDIDVSFSVQQRVKQPRTGISEAAEFKESNQVTELSKPKRDLKKIQYTEEELEAVKSKEDRMVADVRKAIKNVLGVPDEDFENLVVSSLKKGISERRLLREIRDVLEDDSETFAESLKPYLRR